MIKQIFSRYVASISDLKKNPMETVGNANGEPVAILNRNTPAFYCVPARLYEKMLDIFLMSYLSSLLGMGCSCGEYSMTQRFNVA